MVTQADQCDVDCHHTSPGHIEPSAARH